MMFLLSNLWKSTILKIPVRKKQCNEPTTMKKTEANKTNKGRLLLKNMSILI